MGLLHAGEAAGRTAICYTKDGTEHCLTVNRNINCATLNPPPGITITECFHFIIATGPPYVPDFPDPELDANNDKLVIAVKPQGAAGNVDASSIAMTLNTFPVTASLVVTQAGNVVKAVYTKAGEFPSKAAFDVDVSYRDVAHTPFGTRMVVEVPFTSEAVPFTSEGGMVLLGLVLTLAGTLLIRKST
jgi:hypothetical protein